MFFIVCTLLIISFIVCTYYIHSKWKFYLKGVHGLRPIDSLRHHNILARIWPCDDGFMSLIFSALRHTLLPVVFAFLIWVVNNDRLNSLLLFISLIYTISIIPRYKARRADFKLNKEYRTTQEMLKPVKSACFSVVLCAITNYFILLLCYSLRP